MGGFSSPALPCPREDQERLFKQGPEPAFLSLQGHVQIKGLSPRAVTPTPGGLSRTDLVGPVTMCTWQPMDFRTTERRGLLVRSTVTFSEHHQTRTLGQYRILCRQRCARDDQEAASLSTHRTGQERGRVRGKRQETSRGMKNERPFSLAVYLSVPVRICVCGVGGCGGWGRPTMEAANGIVWGKRTRASKQHTCQEVRGRIETIWFQPCFLVERGHAWGGTNQETARAVQPSSDRSRAPGWVSLVLPSCAVTMRYLAALCLGLPSLPQKAIERIQSPDTQSAVYRRLSCDHSSYWV